MAIGYRHKKDCNCGICNVWNKGLTNKEYPKLTGGRKAGWKMSEKLKDKISKATKGIKKPSLLGDNNPAKRPEVRKKISEKLKNRIGTFKGKHHTIEIKNKLSKINIGKKHTEETKNKLREHRLKQIFPYKDTKIEKSMQNALLKENIIFRKHEPIIGQPDIFIEPNICVFCDGDYWHNRDDYKKRDNYVNSELTKKGYKILRFWEHQIYENINKCVEGIKNVIEN